MNPLKALQGIVMYLLLMGAMIYGAWLHFGWLAGVGTGLGLVVMLGAIFGVGRRERRGSVLDEIREKAARRWTCRTCGEKGERGARACLGCGADL